MPLYRDFESASEIDAAYDLMRSVPDPVPLRAAREAASQRARQTLRCELGVSYGESDAETVDVFPPTATSAPVVVFIHGGYWRASSARDYSLAAVGPVARGAMVVVTNYGLCPDVSIDEITHHNRAAIAWTVRNAPRYGGDPARIVLVGHSAGGQQVARLIGEPGVRVGISISGLFDLTPLRHSFLQPLLRLDDALIASESPLFHVDRLPSSSPPLWVTVGSEEPREFLRQSKAYADARAEAGLTGGFEALGGANHYTAVMQLTDPESVVCKRIASLL